MNMSPECYFRKTLQKTGTLSESFPTTILRTHTKPYLFRKSTSTYFEPGCVCTESLVCLLKCENLFSNPEKKQSLVSDLVLVSSELVTDQTRYESNLLLGSSCEQLVMRLPVSQW